MSEREKEGRADGHHLTGRQAKAANALRARATGRSEHHLLHPARVGAHHPRPGVLLLQGHTKGAVRYFGIPAGYEFSTLVEDLIDVSKGTTGLSEKTREILAKVDQDLHIQVFVTPPMTPGSANCASDKPA